MNLLGNASVLAACFMTYALAYIGMTALCLAMEKHYAQAMQGVDLLPRRKTCLKAIGWNLLALAMLFSIHEWNLTIGIVVWIGFVSVAAITMVLMLSYFPRLIAGIGAGAAVVSLISFLAMIFIG